MYWNGKVGSLWGWTLPKVPIVLKNALNKNCKIEKTQWAHMSTSPVIELGVKKICRFWNIMHWNGNSKSFEPLPPLLAEIDKSTQWRFCRKLNFGQLSVEVFFDITRTFGSVRSCSEPTFSFQCIISKMANLWYSLPSFLWEIKTCAYWVFCRRFNFVQFLFQAFFNTIGTFCGV